MTDDRGTFSDDRWAGMSPRAYAQSLLESGRLDLLAQEFADLEGGSRVDSSRATEYLEFLWRSRRYPDLEGVIHGILHKDCSQIPF